MSLMFQIAHPILVPSIATAAAAEGGFSSQLPGVRDVGYPTGVNSAWWGYFGTTIRSGQSGATDIRCR